MADSTLVTAEHITNTKCAKNRIDKKGVQHVVDTTTIHCTAGNKNNKAIDTVLYWERNNIGASATYVVGGDASVCQNVLEADRPWTTGGLSADDMKKLGRNYETGSENDYHAITIEVASNTSGTEMTEAAFAKLIDLVTDICVRHGKTKALWFGDNEELMMDFKPGSKDEIKCAERMVNYKPAPNEMKFTWHRWFAQKACPGQYIMDRMQQLIDEVNRRLAGVAPTPEPAPTPIPEPQPLPPDPTPIIVQDIQAGDTVRITDESLINMLATNYAAMLHGPLKVSAVNGEVATIALTPFDISVNDLLEIGAEAQLVAVTPYIIQVKRVLPLNVYAQPKDGAKVNTTINSAGTYTIVAQTTDNKYGQLKSGAGFVRLADVDRV